MRRESDQPLKSSELSLRTLWVAGSPQATGTGTGKGLDPESVLSCLLAWATARGSMTQDVRRSEESDG